MATTERQEIIQHFVETGNKPKKTVDLAIYLKKDQQRKPRPKLEGQQEYVQKVLDSGYRSKMTESLLDDIHEAFRKKEPEKKKEKQ